jgi:hypothetical protein
MDFVMKETKSGLRYFRKDCYNSAGDYESEDNEPMGSDEGDY